MNYDKYPEIIKPNFENNININNNSKYYFNNKSKELILDITFNTPTVDAPKEFQLYLPEPLEIDEEHDIFLDTVITYNLKSSKYPENFAFLLFINEFNIQSKVATNLHTITEINSENKTNYLNFINKSIIIPNEKQTEKSEHLKIAKSTGLYVTSGVAGITIGNVILPTTSGGNGVSNYYRGYQMIIHGKGSATELSLQGIVRTSSAAVGGAVLQFDQDTLTLLGVPGDTLEETTINDFLDRTGALTESDMLQNMEIELFFENLNHGTIHKGRKHNYVGTINPCTLHSITGKVSDMGHPTGLNTSKDGLIVPTPVESSTDVGGAMNYKSPFWPSSNTNGSNKNQERMLVEFKLVPRN